MTNSVRTAAVVLVAFAALSGCKQGSAAATPSASATPAVASSEDRNMVVARYAGKTVTLGQVDDSIAAQLKQLDKQKLEMRQQAAEQMAVQEMVKAEAAAAGQNEEDWLKANIEGKLPDPAEAEIQKVFDENQARMPPGSTLESMREQIKGFLQQGARRERASQVFEELKTKNQYAMLLEEPRVTVEAIGPSRGPADAKVTIVEFSDFQCPFCSRAEGTVDEVMEKYAGKVRVVFRNFPLEFHPNAPKAAEAALCANDQGKFWEMHKELFANQQQLSVENLKSYAEKLQLDATKFNECLDSGAKKADVDADHKAGAEVGVSGTPAFFINGKMLSGAQPFAEFKKVIDAELAR